VLETTGEVVAPGTPEIGANFPPATDNTGVPIGANFQPATNPSLIGAGFGPETDPTQISLAPGTATMTPDQIVAFQNTLDQWAQVIPPGDPRWQQVVTFAAQQPAGGQNTLRAAA
jgi:hypothetical protein